jgi:hypothetical protein
MKLMDHIQQSRTSTSPPSADESPKDRLPAAKVSAASVLQQLHNPAPAAGRRRSSYFFTDNALQEITRRNKSKLAKKTALVESSSLPTLPSTGRKLPKLPKPKSETAPSGAVLSSMVPFMQLGLGSISEQAPSYDKPLGRRPSVLEAEIQQKSQKAADRQQQRRQTHIQAAAIKRTSMVIKLADAALFREGVQVNRRQSVVQKQTAKLRRSSAQLRRQQGIFGLMTQLEIDPQFKVGEFAVADGDHPCSDAGWRQAGWASLIHFASSHDVFRRTWDKHVLQTAREKASRVIHRCCTNCYRKWKSDEAKKHAVLCRFTLLCWRKMPKCDAKVTKAADTARDFCRNYLSTGAYFRLTVYKFTHRVKLAQRRFRAFQAIQVDRKLLLVMCWKKVEHAVKRMLAEDKQSSFTTMQLSGEASLANAVAKLKKQRKRAAQTPIYENPEMIDVVVPASTRDTMIIKYLCEQRSVQGDAAIKKYEKDYKAWLWSDHFIMNTKVSVEDIRGLLNKSSKKAIAMKLQKDQEISKPPRWTPMRILTSKGTGFSFLRVIRDAVLLEHERAQECERASKTSTMYTNLSCKEHQQKITENIEIRTEKMEKMMKNSALSVSKARSKARTHTRIRRGRSRSPPPQPRR